MSEGIKDSINIRQIKKVTVNENGDTIDINVNDREMLLNIQKTINGFYDILKSGDLASKSMEEFNIVCYEQTQTIDKIFGENTVYKVFGTKNPTISALINFYIEIMEILSKYVNAYQTKLEENINNKFGEKYLTRKIRKST